MLYIERPSRNLLSRVSKNIWSGPFVATQNQTLKEPTRILPRRIQQETGVHRETASVYLKQLEPRFSHVTGRDGKWPQRNRHFRGTNSPAKPAISVTTDYGPAKPLPSGKPRTVVSLSAEDSAAARPSAVNPRWNDFSLR